MPAMLRWNKKAAQIHEDVMGVPQNTIDVSSPGQKKIKKKLINEEGSWAQ